MPEVQEIKLRSDYTALFVDREPAKKIFEEKYENLKKNSYEIIYISGMPGVGKSRLAEELKRIVSAKGFSKKCLEMDFYRNIKESYEYLEWMAIELHESNGVVFPLFSYALIVFYLKRNVEYHLNTDNIKALSHRHKFIYDYLDNAFDISALIPIAGAYSSAFGSTITKLVSFAEDKIRNKYQQAKLPENYVEILNSNSQIIEKNLPLFWATDVSKFSVKSSVPLMFFLDTYEAYISELNLDGDDRRRDYWLFDKKRGIARKVPNSIWVVTGRDSLYENDDTICKVSLDCLPPEWQNTMLEDAHIPNSISECIKEKTGGLPLHIELCIDTYLELISQGKTPCEDDFEGTYEDLLTRYIRYMNDKKEILDVVYFLACVGKWNDDSILEEIHKHDISFSLSAYETVKGLSFIINSKDGDYEVHSVARKIFKRYCPDIIIQEFNKRVSSLKLNDKLSPQDEYAVFCENVEEDYLNGRDDIYSQTMEIFEKNKQYLQELLTTCQFEKFNRLFSQIMNNIEVDEIENTVFEKESLLAEFIEFLRMGTVYYDLTEQNKKAAEFQKIIINLKVKSAKYTEREVFEEKYRLASFLLMIGGQSNMDEVWEIGKECIDTLDEEDEITDKVINLYMIRRPEATIEEWEYFVNNQKALHGDNSPRGIKAEISLAVKYKRNGKIYKAIKIGKELCRKMDMYLSENDIDCINANHNLAIAYLELAVKLRNSDSCIDRDKSLNALVEAKNINLKVCDTIEKNQMDLGAELFEYYYSLVKSMVLLGEFKQVKVYCEKLLELSQKYPQESETMHMVYDTMATICRNEGNYKSAIEYMELLVATDEKTWGKDCVQSKLIKENIKAYKKLMK